MLTLLTKYCNYVMTIFIIISQWHMSYNTARPPLQDHLTKTTSPPPHDLLMKTSHDTAIPTMSYVFTVILCIHVLWYNEYNTITN